MFIHRVLTRIHTRRNFLILTEKISPYKNNVHRQLSTKTNNLLIKNVIYTASKRNISFKSAKIEKFMRLDKIPNDYELIYRASMSPYIYAAQISAAVGTLGVIIMAIFSYNYNPTKSFAINLSGINLHNILYSQAQFIIFSCAFIAINIAVLLLTSKCPIRIYFNQDAKKYIAVIHGKIPKTKDIVEFNAGEMKHMPQSKILPWGDFRYQLKSGKKLVLLDHYFRKPDDMNIMLGYTKL